MLNLLRFLICVILALFATAVDELRGDEVRGVLVAPGRVSPEFLAAWKAKGANAVVVLLDDTTKAQWRAAARTVEREGMALWPWVEVARNRAMADAHPERMA